MPLHDWTKVGDVVWHAFHTTWIGALQIALNRGILPKGYTALAEKRFGIIPDVSVMGLTQTRKIKFGPQDRRGAVAVLEQEPTARFVETPAEESLANKRSLAIRRDEDKKLIALIEIVSPANKTKANLPDFLDKLAGSLREGVHVLIVDLQPPGPHDKHGIHRAFWQYCGYDLRSLHAAPKGKDRTVASYLAHPFKALHDPVGVGDPLPEIPLFLNADYYVRTPLESTYQHCFEGIGEENQRALNRSR